jgi:A/G-specific adenine glycosylase
MTPVEVEVASPPGRVMEADGWLWYNTRSPASVGLAAPVAKMLDAFGEQRQTRSGD